MKDTLKDTLNKMLTRDSNDSYAKRFRESLKIQMLQEALNNLHKNETEKELEDLSKYLNTWITPDTI